MFIKLTMTSKEGIDNLKRKEYINKFYRNCVTYSDGKRNIGILDKFNNAIGFKNVMDYVDNQSVIHRALVDSPEDYKNPSDLLIWALSPCLIDNNIVSFTVKQEKIKHPNELYSYDTNVIMIKFKKFLEKIFPNTNLSIEYLNELKDLSITDFVVNEFFLGLDYKEEYTVETSINRLLNDEEIDNVLKVLKTMTILNISINQSYCKTCSEYSNELSPYHIEIVYN